MDSDTPSSSAAPRRWLNAAVVGQEASRETWALAAREKLEEAAGTYGETVTLKELADWVQGRSLIRTNQLSCSGSATCWAGWPTLARPSGAAAVLVVRGRQGPGEPAYPCRWRCCGTRRSVTPTTTRRRERLACYRWFGADASRGGGEPVVTVRAIAPPRRPCVRWPDGVARARPSDTGPAAKASRRRRGTDRRRRDAEAPGRSARSTSPCSPRTASATTATDPGGSSQRTDPRGGLELRPHERLLQSRGVCEPPPGCRAVDDPPPALAPPGRRRPERAPLDRGRTCGAARCARRAPTARTAATGASGTPPPERFPGGIAEAGHVGGDRRRVGVGALARSDGAQQRVARRRRGCASADARPCWSGRGRRRAGGPARS